jgi:hypothetical protein
LENEILTACQELTPTVESGVIIETPKIYPFNPELNTQIYSDLALSTDLKTYALTHPLTQAECTRVGFALGKWLKNFHTWGAAPEQASLREKIKENTEMRALKYQINYPTMIATIANFPELLEDSREIFEDIAKDMKEKLDASEGDLIHGDFWTGKYVPLTSSLPRMKSKQSLVWFSQILLSHPQIPHSNFISAIGSSAVSQSRLLILDKCALSSMSLSTLRISMLASHSSLPS